jgi:hypothetical protein
MSVYLGKYRWCKHVSRFLTNAAIQPRSESGSLAADKPLYLFVFRDNYKVCNTVTYALTVNNACGAISDVAWR